MWQKDHSGLMAAEWKMLLQMWCIGGRFVEINIPACKAAIFGTQEGGGGGGEGKRKGEGEGGRGRGRGKGEEEGGGGRGKGGGRGGRGGRGGGSLKMRLDRSAVPLKCRKVGSRLVTQLAIDSPITLTRLHPPPSYQ